MEQTRAPPAAGFAERVEESVGDPGLCPRPVLESPLSVPPPCENGTGSGARLAPRSPIPRAGRVRVPGTQSWQSWGGWDWRWTVGSRFPLCPAAGRSLQTGLGRGEGSWVQPWVCSPCTLGPRASEGLGFPTHPAGGGRPGGCLRAPFDFFFGKVNWGLLTAGWALTACIPGRRWAGPGSPPGLRPACLTPCSPPAAPGP